MKNLSDLNISNIKFENNKLSFTFTVEYTLSFKLKAGNVAIQQKEYNKQASLDVVLDLSFIKRKLDIDFQYKPQYDINPKKTNLGLISQNLGYTILDGIAKTKKDITKDLKKMLQQTVNDKEPPLKIANLKIESNIGYVECEKITEEIVNHLKENEEIMNDNK